MLFFFLTTCHLHLCFQKFFSNFQQGKRGRSDSTKRDNCTDCEAGEYADSPNAVKCQACNPGEYQKEAGKTACLPCLPGEHGRADRKSCDKCAIDTYQDEAAQSSCKSCGKGRKPGVEGSTSCLACVAGTFKTKMNGEDICEECDKGQFANASDLDSCVLCGAGHYQDQTRAASCLPCLPGKYGRADAADRSDCDECKVGTASAEAGRKTPCEASDPGTIVLGGGTTAVKVPEGSYLTQCDDDACKNFAACPAGWSSGTQSEPLRTCKQCKAGKTSSTASIDCRDCTKGKFGIIDSSGAGICNSCLPGYFQPEETSATSCTSCPQGWAQENEGESSCKDLGGIKPTDCDNTVYWVSDKGETGKSGCVACPSGGSCKGAIDSTGIRNLFGWWQIPVDLQKEPTKMFAECLFAPSCLGAPNLALIARHGEADKSPPENNVTCNVQLGFRNVSRLCHACAVGYKREGTNQCARCPKDQAGNWGLIFLGITVMLGVLAYIVGDSLSQGGVTYVSASIQKIIINFLQVVTLCNGFPLRWPPALQSLFYIQGAVSTLGDHLLNVDCLTATSSAAELYYSKQQMFATLPVMICFVSFFFWWVISKRKKESFFQRRASRQHKTYKDKFIVTITSVLYLIYPTLCKNAVSVVARGYCSSGIPT